MRNEITATAYIENGMLYIAHNWSAEYGKVEFAPAIKCTAERTDDSTHELAGMFFSFPKPNGGKFAFIDAFQKYGNITFTQLA